jgi:hypothetical protein
MNTNGRNRIQEPTIAGSVSGMAHDAIELAELQTHLLLYDVKKSGKRARTSLALCVCGACVLLGSLPIVLIALAELFISQLEWTNAAGYALAAAIGLLLSAILFVLAYIRFKSGIFSLERSREELNRNIAWFKSQLSKSRRGGSDIPSL